MIKSSNFIIMLVSMDGKSLLTPLYLPILYYLIPTRENIMLWLRCLKNNFIQIKIKTLSHIQVFICFYVWLFQPLLRLTQPLKPSACLYYSSLVEVSESMLKSEYFNRKFRPFLCLSGPCLDLRILNRLKPIKMSD